MSLYAKYENYDFIRKFKNEMSNVLKNLKQFPKLYPISFRKGDIEYRKFYVRKYVFIYCLDEEKKSVMIIRIHHQNQNYQNMYV